MTQRGLMISFIQIFMVLGANRPLLKKIVWESLHFCKGVLFV